MNRPTLLIRLIAFAVLALTIATVGPAIGRETSRPLQAQSSPITLSGNNFQVLTAMSRDTMVGDTAFYIVQGVIKNTAASTVANGSLEIRLAMRSGMIVTGRNYRIDLDVLGPGDTAPFRIIQEHPSWDEVVNYELDAAATETSEAPAHDLVVINDLHTMEDGHAVWRGELRNSGNRALAATMEAPPAVMVAVAYGAKGEIVDYQTHVFSSILNPGRKAPFLIRTTTESAIARWEYWVNYHALKPQVGAKGVQLPEVSSQGDLGDDIEFSGVSSQYDRGQGLQIRGSATNRLNRAVDRLDLTVVFRDEQGRVLNWVEPRLSEWQGNPLPPGQARQFTANVHDSYLPSHYTSVDVYPTSD